MQWIKRTDRQPKKGEDIFIWKSDDSEGLTKGWYFGTYKNEGLYVYGNMKAKPIKDFSHWMPEMSPPNPLSEDASEDSLGDSHK